MKRPNHLLTKEISLTPLVDFCLILLITLMVVAPMVRGDKHLEAASSARSSAPAVRRDQLAVAMSADGAVFVEQRRVDRQELSGLLVALHDAGPHRPVILKGDRRLRYDQVRQLMEEIYRAGFQRVALMPGPRARG
ncbi:MAG TPA: biopolymer transporter ExbD [Thermoanaerobaculia bacterium]|nr:biopolymer transporter ExbD [Thermoanaerobaculia bacterium]